MKMERYFEAKEHENLKELIQYSCEKYAERTAFVTKIQKDKKVEYKETTYAKLLKDINCLGTKFYELGYANKRIAVVGRNRYEWVVAHLTNLLGGIVSVPLDKELQVDELESCLIRSKAEVVVFDEKYIQNIEEIKKRNNTNIKDYICMSEQKEYKNIHTLVGEGKKLLESGNKEFLDAEIDSYKMSILLFTSGTTSKSKAVMLSQKNIASNVYAMQLVEDIRKEDVNLAFLPYHHIFGSTCMIVMLACGVKTGFPDGLRYIAQNLKEYKVSIFVGVPLLVEAIYKKVEQGIEKKGKTKIVNVAKKVSNFLLKFKINIRRKIFKSVIDELGGGLRFIISGGAPLDRKVAQGFNELGINLVQGYGLTETAPVIAAENYKRVKYGSIGIPLENVTLKIDNPDENGIGEIKVKGPNVMLGYYENEEATNQVLKDGWFYTGDLAYIDKQGYIFITGRKKDVIVLKNGKKAFPEEIETLINRIDEVSECIVYGIPDKQDVNDVKLSVKVVYDKEVVAEKHPGIEQKDLETLIWNKIKEVNKTLPPYKYIKNMVLTDEELIKTTTKKVKRNEEIKKLLEK